MCKTQSYNIHCEQAETYMVYFDVVKHQLRNIIYLLQAETDVSRLQKMKKTKLGTHAGLGGLGNYPRSILASAKNLKTIITSLIIVDLSFKHVGWVQ